MPSIDHGWWFASEERPGGRALARAQEALTAAQKAAEAAPPAPCKANVTDPTAA
ncbi:MAG: hypothetical protein ACLP0J_26000 [Solirubrobacteraceae bacterium]